MILQCPNDAIIDIQHFGSDWLLIDDIILADFDLIRHEATTKPHEQFEAQKKHLKVIHESVQQLLVNSNGPFCFKNVTLCFELNELYSNHQWIISSSHTDNPFMHIIFQWYPCE